MPKTLMESVKACNDNAQRILCDIKSPKEGGTAATRYYLAIIAQEECAKAFLLHLAARGIIPWNDTMLEATKSHQCKHLLGLLIEYMCPSYEELCERLSGEITGLPKLKTPERILDVLCLLRHEKFGKRVSKALMGPKALICEESVDDVVRGMRDKNKQDALYVNILKNGAVGTTPKMKITAPQAEIEYKTAWGFVYFLAEIIATGTSVNFYYRQIVSDLEKMSSDPKKAMQLDRIMKSGTDARGE